MENYKHELFISDRHGVYVPRVFAQCADRSTFYGISKEDWSILESTDPYSEDSEILWETWEHVLNNASCITHEEKEYTLHHDGDLWLIPLWYGENEWEEYFSY